jgi:hypothetical protein
MSALPAPRNKPAQWISDSQNPDLWCTGKDSNLRTSLGGTDLQSVGFNHSPTCAKFSGDAAVARPADHHRGPPGKRSRKPANHVTVNFANLTFAIQGNQGSRKKTPRRSLTLITAHRKSSAWSALEKPVAPLPSPPNRRKIRLLLSFSGAGEGIRTPDPLITNQMLYRLSYASNSGDRCAFAQTNPTDPCQMSGTIS